MTTPDDGSIKANWFAKSLQQIKWVRKYLVSQIVTSENSWQIILYLENVQDIVIWFKIMFGEFVIEINKTVL